MQHRFRKEGIAMEQNIVHCIVLTLDLFTAFMLILIISSSTFEKDKNTLLKCYIGMAGTCAFALLMEAVSVMLFFSDWQSADMHRMILNDLAIIGGYGLSFFYVCYVSNMIGKKHKLCRLAIRTLGILGVISAVILVVGSGFELFFTFENGATTPGQFFIGLFAFDMVACLTGIVLIIAYAKKLNTKDMVALLTLPVFIFLSAAIQYMSFHMMYGLFFMAAVSLFIIYLMIQGDRNRQQAEQEKQLMDMNVALMISQIQPHFLYNALSSIRRMIKKDPEVAEKAVENFSMYLRQNLESMNRVEPIPFSTELKHLEQYLYLEKLRFGDRLCVEYEIGYSDFVLPVLSLQPIVENAARHGVLKKEEGGTVWIKTYREGTNVVLTVKDDGVGFQSDDLRKTDRMHIGLDNVKSRIEMQCKGTVRVESEVGRGTTVTMTIPLM